MSHWKLYKDIDLYFVTSTVVDWIPVFTEIKYFSIIIDSLNYCAKNKGLLIYAYVIMLNHLHMIISKERDVEGDVSGVMRDFKRHTSNSISGMLSEDKKVVPLQIFAEAAKKENTGNDFKIWQGGFHPIAVETDQFCRQKINYIHDNPVRKGYVIKPEYWFYSSAQNYAGISNGPIDVHCLF